MVNILINSSTNESIINKDHCSNNKKNIGKSKKKYYLKRDILKYINNSNNILNNFSIKNSCICVNLKKKTFIKTKLLYYNRSTNFNYMDKKVEEVCTKIAKDLRKLIGKNIFFDLINGELIFFI